MTAKKTTKKPVAKKSATAAKPEAEKPKSPLQERKFANFSDVKEGDVMAVVTFVKVTHKNRYSDAIFVENIINGMDFQVNGRDLIESMPSADRYLSEESLTMTQLAEKFVTLYNTPFTVVFEKVDGSERLLRGKYLYPETLLGRLKVLDLDLNEERLVDHRTIKYIIANGVKYTKKK